MNVLNFAYSTAKSLPSSCLVDCFSHKSAGFLISAWSCIIIQFYVSRQACTSFTASYFYDHKLQKIKMLGHVWRSHPLAFSSTFSILRASSVFEVLLESARLQIFSLSFYPSFSQAVPRSIPREALQHNRKYIGILARNFAKEAGHGSSKRGLIFE